MMCCDALPCFSASTFAFLAFEMCLLGIAIKLAILLVDVVACFPVHLLL